MNPSSQPDPESPRGPPPADFLAYEASLPPAQQWTTDGYPIVDGKYHNLDTDEIQSHTGRTVGGPPNITVHWHVRFNTEQGHKFLVTTRTIYSTFSISECIIRIGNMLRGGEYEVQSLNATPYAVYLVATSEAAAETFQGALETHGLT